MSWNVQIKTALVRVSITIGFSSPSYISDGDRELELAKREAIKIGKINNDWKFSFRTLIPLD